MAGDVDVVIVGAGISGIGVARALKISSPGTTFRILEARDAIGGTWDLFRYPGVRSDSDLYTFGYQFRPWTDADSIASGASILDYLRRTVAEEGIEEHISLQRRVVSAEWSSRTGLWTVQVRTGGSDAVETLTAAWLFCAGGYYRYDEGYRAEIPGLDRFQGQRVHPQHWPEDLRYDGKRVVVIGSGATAVTLVPALAKEAVRVTATGLSVLVFGGIALRVDGEEVLLPDRVAYKGIMLDGVPNFAFAIGYTNASWTLKVGLLADYFCRLLTYMAEHGYTTVTPRRPAGMETRPLLDFAAGYVTRAADALPRQGAEGEWRMSMNYYADVRNLRRGRVRSPSLQFGRAG
ncbi:flavin-containing monooxygenase [Micromonospora sp. DT81.3]|uniref:flavin-containing monooxygenase n=1 Tax=Micromonospora sp. DT81.3 TaxID=3416523 RepID=UPI003CF48FB6